MNNFRRFEPVCTSTCIALWADFSAVDEFASRCASVNYFGTYCPQNIPISARTRAVRTRILSI